MGKTSITRPFATGRKSSITTAVQLASACRAIGAAKIGVKVYADSANGAPVYVGTSDQVTNDSADATDGFPIPAGKSEMFYVAGPHLLWAKAGSACKVWWLHQ